MAQAWGKEKDYGSVEKGKVADVIIVRGDPSKNISDTQNVEMVFIDGKKMDTSFHADYKNPMPRPIEDRPEVSRIEEHGNYNSCFAFARVCALRRRCLFALQVRYRRRCQALLSSFPIPTGRPSCRFGSHGTPGCSRNTD